MKKHLIETRYIVIAIAISVLAIAALIVHQFVFSNGAMYSANTTDGSYTDSMDISSPGATPTATPLQEKADYKVKDLSLNDDASEKSYLEWTNIGKSGVSYVAKSFEDSSKTGDIFVDGVYSSAVLTLSKPTEEKTSNGKKYYIAELPSKIENLSQLKSSAAIADSGPSTSHEIKNINPNTVYTYFVETMDGGSLAARSIHAVVFRGSDIIGNVTLPFKDVPVSAWFHPYVSYIYFKGVVDKADYYYPDRAVNRAESVKLTVKALGITVGPDDTKFADNYFTDVSSNDWYAPYLGYMTKKGWVKGIPDPNEPGSFIFDGNAPLTRAQLLKIIISAYDVDVSVLGKKEIFKDVPAGVWFAPYIEYAYSKGIIGANADMMFYPERTINRAEIAKILSMAMQKM